MDELRRVKEKLVEIKSYVAEIEGIMPNSLEEYTSSAFTIKRTLERDLQLINEDQMDILSLLARLKDTGIAASEEGLIDKFRKIFGSKTIENLKKQRRLRNMLTHTYKTRLYDELVFDSAKNLKTIRAFISEVETVIGRKPKT